MIGIDDGGELTPVGIAGELCIGGDGVDAGHDDQAVQARVDGPGRFGSFTLGVHTVRIAWQNPGIGSI